uniref:Phosphatidate cytidylyltransferase, mitochondrial n=2 Tax=Arion vulgaris TaxID=1028688 RepID=A0A0B6ZZU2_9EUPU
MSLKIVSYCSSSKLLYLRVRNSNFVCNLHWRHLSLSCHRTVPSSVNLKYMSSCIHFNNFKHDSQLKFVRPVSNFSLQHKHTGADKNDKKFKNSNEKSQLFVDTSSLVEVEQSPQRILYNRIVESFPEGIQLAFAYGSGAIQQQNSLDSSKNMLDFIFVVDKPKKWHRLNIEKHPHHYSFLKHFGSNSVTRIQERYGAGTYFNTLVPMEGRLVKYGVISTARLITDLLDWESLYISGRMHKPVSLIVIPTNEDLLMAMKMNLRSAVHAALLLLPDVFTEEQFYTKVASLSYAGDIRMGLAEDKNKIANIVKPNMQLFCRMYGPLLLEEEHVTWWQTEGQLEQALTYHSRHHHLKCLPGQVLYGLLLQKYQVGVFPDLEEIIKRHAYDSECGKYVASSVRAIVKRSSLTQSLKGILTAGLTKSLRYTLNKVLKKLKSR